MIDRRRFVTLAAASALTPSLTPSWPRPAAAQTKWPTRHVRVVVPFPPGGGTDAITRLLGAKLSQIWGHELMVENKGGGATTVGTEYVAKAAAPDGYTFLLQSVPLVTNKALIANLPYDPIADLAPVVLIGDYPNVMVVPMSSPATSVREFIAHAKANAGNLSFGSPGYGTSPHLSGELFKRMAGVELTHVPYRGGGPAYNDLIPGRLDVMFNNSTSAVPFIKSNRLRPLGVTSLIRNAALPDVPTIAEAGVPGFEVIGFYAFFAPARTPPAIIAKFHADTVAAMADPVIRQRIDQLGVRPIGAPPAELGAFVKSEMAKWGPIIKEAGIKVE
jgi:tripartite-type tricarboxylate transporter receptor subunit TctC